MKRSTWLIILGLPCLFSLALWLIFSNEREHKTVTSVASASMLQSKKHTPVTSNEKEWDVAVEQASEEFNPYEDEVLKAQIQQAADIYAENIKYPVTSQPIYNSEDVREHKPFEQSKVILPFPVDDNDESPIKISAATNTFQYFQGDTVVVQVSIKGATDDISIQVNGLISGSNGDIPITAKFEADNENSTTFFASFDTKLAPPDRLTPEMLVKINVVVGNRDLFTTVPFRYTIASAQVISVRQAQPVGPELIIPLQLDVFQAGYYFVSAVLEDATTGRPLIQLQAESRLPQGNGVINLKAHIAALRRQGSEGPYILRSIQTYRAAEVGESLDAPASSSQTQFKIEGFTFSAYENEEVVDDLAKERLDFLRQLGTVEGENQEP